MYKAQLFCGQVHVREARAGNRERGCEAEELVSALELPWRRTTRHTGAHAKRA